MSSNHSSPSPFDRFSRMASVIEIEREKAGFLSILRDMKLIRPPSASDGGDFATAYDDF